MLRPKKPFERSTDLNERDQRKRVLTEDGSQGDERAREKAVFATEGSRYPNTSITTKVKSAVRRDKPEKKATLDTKKFEKKTSFSLDQPIRKQAMNEHAGKKQRGEPAAPLTRVEQDDSDAYDSEYDSEYDELSDSEEEEEEHLEKQSTHSILTPGSLISPLQPTPNSTIGLDSHISEGQYSLNSNVSAGSAEGKYSFGGYALSMLGLTRRRQRSRNSYHSLDSHTSHFSAAEHDIENVTSSARQGKSNQHKSTDSHFDDSDSEYGQEHAAYQTDQSDNTDGKRKKHRQHLCSSLLRLFKHPSMSNLRVEARHCARVVRTDAQLLVDSYHTYVAGSTSSAVIGSGSSTKMKRGGKRVDYQKPSRAKAICSLFRLSVVAFLILLILAQCLAMMGFVNSTTRYGSITSDGTTYSIFNVFGELSSTGRSRSGLYNVWESFDSRWKHTDKLSWSELRALMHKYDFDFLMSNKSTSKRSDKELENDPDYVLFTKIQKIYQKKEGKHSIFHTLNNYAAMKSTDLIQIKRPAVRTKRADEHRATRTFGCMRDGCRGLAIEDLLDRGWQMRFRAAEVNDTFKDINYRVTFLLTDTTHITVMQKNRPDLYEKIYNSYQGKCYMSGFDGGDAIGGNKGQQIVVKEKYVKNFGCKFNDLNIAPKSYRLYKREECHDLMAKIGDSELSWILKPETGSQGSGITFHNEISSIIAKVPQFFPCKEYGSDSKLKATERYLVQQYLSKPLLLKKSKFDVRVYMLIASSQPYLVFYHEGYLRRSLADYSPNSKDRRVYLTNTHFQSMKKGFKLSDHIWPFSMMQDHLSTHGRTGSHYVETILNPYIKKVALFIFQTAREKLVHRKGTFHVFGIDFMIDADYHVWFIEANGYPGFTWSINFDSRAMVEEMFNVVQQVHENPRFYMMMQPGDRYGGFEMIFNEIEEERARKSKLRSPHIPNVRGAYNPCLEFRQNLAYTKPLRNANKLLARFSGKEGRTDKIKDFAQFIPNVNQPKNEAVLRLPLTPQQPALSNHVGDKSWIIRAEKNFLKQHGCKREKLRYTPPTYLLNDAEECQAFFKDYNPNNEASLSGALDGSSEKSEISLTVSSLNSLNTAKWVLKNQQGVQLYTTKEELYPLYGQCKSVHSHGHAGGSKDVIVQKLVTERQLFKNKWWDMKVYFLISSTQPFMVFYHQGYLRTSKIHINKALKENAELILQQSRTQKRMEKEQQEVSGKDGDDGFDRSNGRHHDFSTEELLEGLEDELGVDLTRLSEILFKNPQQLDPSTPNKATSAAENTNMNGINIAGLKNLQLNVREIGAPSDPLGGLTIGGVDLRESLGDLTEEKWEPEEFVTGSVWQVGEEFWSFDDFQDHMAKEMIIGAKYIDSVFDAYVKRVVNLLFRSIKDQKNRTSNAYELYEADFMIDNHFVIHYLDSKVVDPENAFPNVDDPKLNEDKITFLKQLAELVLEINAAPAAFARMLRGDSYGDWRLIFSEMEEYQRKNYNKDYDPCEEFKRNLMVHKGSIYKNSWLNNYAEKRHAANKRELNKYIQNKWTTCKYKPSKELMSSCIRNTISYRYKIYIQKEGIEYQEGYVENRIRDLIAKREAERSSG